MGIVVTREAVKRAASVSSNVYDSEIEALIAELLPVIEYSLAKEALDDVGIEPVLRLGAVEIIAGEFLARRLREAGATERFEVGGIRVGESPQAGARLSDPYGLIERGWSRLCRYLKPVYALSNTRHRERRISEAEVSGW